MARVIALEKRTELTEVKAEPADGSMTRIRDFKKSILNFGFKLH